MKTILPYIPYQGNKQNLLKQIYNTINKYTNKKVFIDLFGGGGSVSFFFYKKDIKLYIMNIIKDIIL